MKINLLLVFLFTTFLCGAQTKLIAHKSHSGSRHSFSKAYEKNLFDINRSNFGTPGNSNIVILEAVIAVNDSVTVLKMKESNVCYPFGTSYKDLKESDFKDKTHTLINHELLYKNNSLALIKSREKDEYPICFQNPIRKIEFIGFKE